MGATHALKRTRWPAYLEHARGKGLESLCMWEKLVVTVSTEDMLTFTAPVLPALSDYSVHK